jgi:hypothetical protein
MNEYYPIWNYQTFDEGYLIVKDGILIGEVWFA